MKAELVYAQLATGPSPLTVQLTASVSGGVPPYAFEWSFGDGSAATAGNPVTHDYQAAGTYTVSLSLTDAIGNMAGASGTIDVTQGPIKMVSGKVLKVASPNGHPLWLFWWNGPSEINFQSIDGTVEITPSIDGNEMTLASTYISGSGNQPNVQSFFPGDSYAGGLSAGISWGSTLTFWMIDYSVFPGGGLPTAGPSAFVSWLEQNFPGAYLGTVELVIPQPVATIKDLGVVSGDTHSIEVTYSDADGNPLNAVANPGGVIPVSPAGQTGIAVSVSGGSAAVNVTGPFTFEVAFGGVYSGGAAFSPNTIISNELTI